MILYAVEWRFRKTGGAWTRWMVYVGEDICTVHTDHKLVDEWCEAYSKEQNPDAQFQRRKYVRVEEKKKPLRKLRVRKKLRSRRRAV